MLEPEFDEVNVDEEEEEEEEVWEPLKALSKELELCRFWMSAGRRGIPLLLLDSCFVEGTTGPKSDTRSVPGRCRAFESLSLVIGGKSPSSPAFRTCTEDEDGLSGPPESSPCPSSSGCLVNAPSTRSASLKCTDLARGLIGGGVVGREYDLVFT